jgi:uncharacterized membrane-anchored protein
MIFVFLFSVYIAVLPKIQNLNVYPLLTGIKSMWLAILFNSLGTAFGDYLE